MRGRNRKKYTVDSSVLHVPFTGMVIFIVLALLGYVWLNCCCEAVGREIKKLETEGRRLETEYNNASRHWQCLKTPGSLSAALARCGLVMSWPTEAQIVRLDRMPAPQAVAGAAGVPEWTRLARLEQDSFRE